MSWWQSILDPADLFHSEPAAAAGTAGTSSGADFDQAAPPPAAAAGRALNPRDNPPGGGNPFFAGLEVLFTSPTSFAKDALPGGDSGYIPPAKPGGGSAFVAGLEETVRDPAQAAKDLSAGLGLPSSTTFIIAAAIVTLGILGAAYIAHKAL